MNTAAIDSAGLKPVEAELARLAAIASTAELARALARMHNLGVGGFFRIRVEADEKNSEVNALYAYQGGMSLPSKGYYFDEQFEKIRAAFAEHVAKMLALAGDTPESAAAGAKTVFEVEKALAANAKTPAELRDALANYNKMPTADLAGKVPVFPLARYLADRGIAGPAAGTIIVGQPKFFEGLQAQLAARPLSDWKIYLRYHVLPAQGGHSPGGAARAGGHPRNGGGGNELGGKAPPPHARKAGGQGRMEDVAPRGNPLLRPGGEQHHFPRRNPPAAVLRFLA